MKNTIKQVVIISLILNIVLALIKLLFGYLGNTSSLMSDGYNSLSDVFVSMMILITLKISHKSPDENHPYGHEKFEGLMYFILGLVLLLTALFIGFNGTKDLINHFVNDKPYLIPKPYTIYVAIIAIAIKLFLSYITLKTSKKYESPSLKADSINHLADVFATLASLVGIILSRFNMVYFDYIASIVIAVIILISSIEVLKEAVSFLVDASAEKEVVKNISTTIKKTQGVIKIDDLKVRKHMKHYYVDVEISVDELLSLKEAHQIAENVHHLIEDTYPHVLHCMVHVNPGKTKK